MELVLGSCPDSQWISPFNGTCGIDSTAEADFMFSSFLRNSSLASEEVVTIMDSSDATAMYSSESMFSFVQYPIISSDLDENHNGSMAMDFRVAQSTISFTPRNNAIEGDNFMVIQGEGSVDLNEKVHNESVQEGPFKKRHREAIEVENCPRSTKMKMMKVNENNIYDNTLSLSRSSWSSCSSEYEWHSSHELIGQGGLITSNSHSKGKARASRGSTNDPQSLYAKKRRERINERLKILQKLVPNGTKVDISTMLEEAVEYVKFLQLQIKLLSSDELWMYAPIAYNGMDISAPNLKY